MCDKFEVANKNYRSSVELSAEARASIKLPTLSYCPVRN